MKTYSNRFFAHRGLHGDPNVIPENSMAAFHRAVTRGYGIEMDVRLTADGQAVLFQRTESIIIQIKIPLLFLYLLSYVPRHAEMQKKAAAVLLHVQPQQP